MRNTGYDRANSTHSSASSSVVFSVCTDIQKRPRSKRFKKHSCGRKQPSHTRIQYVLLSPTTASHLHCNCTPHVLPPTYARTSPQLQKGHPSIDEKQNTHVLYQHLTPLDVAYLLDARVKILDQVVLACNRLGQSRVVLQRPPKRAIHLSSFQLFRRWRLKLPG